MRIRLAEEEDFTRILQIEQVSYKNPWPEYLFRSHLGEAGFRVYEDSGVVIGYIVIAIRIPTLFERIEKRTRALVGQEADLEERRGHLMNLAIDPRYRRTGIAKKLLQEGIDYMLELDAEFIELEVRKSNQVAIELYEEFGFEIAGQISRYYNDGEDAYLMRLSFPAPNIANQL